MSTSSRYVLQTIFTGRDQVTPVIRTVRSGMRGLWSDMQVGNRAAGTLNQQMRALATTIRYAFAGATVFGMVGALKTWGEFQAKLGEISSIATSRNGIPIVGQQLQQLGDSLIQVSIDTNQPIEDLQKGVLALYSTIENVPPNQAKEMMEVIAGTAVTSQANVEGVTNAILGMLNAFGKGPSEAKKFGNLFRTVIAESAGMTGEVYSEQSGRLYSAGRLGGFKPSEIAGLSIAASRFGGSMPSNMQSLAQMMQYLMNPPTEKAEKAMESIGLSRETRANLGGMGTLDKLLDTVRNMGGVNKYKGKSFAEVASTLRYADETGDQSQALDPKASHLISQLFGRIQSQRMVAILSLLSGDTPVGKNKTIHQYNEDAKKATENTKTWDDAVKRATDPAKFQRAGKALRGMGVELTNAFAPFLNKAAEKTIDWSRFVGAHNKQFAFGGGAAVLGLGAARLFGAGALIRGGLGAISGRAGQAFVREEAIRAELNPARAGILGGSSTNPLFVVVVGQLFGGNYRPGTPLPAGKAGTAEEIAKKAPWWAIPAAYAARGARAARGAITGVGAFAAESPALFDAISELSGGDPFGYDKRAKFKKTYPLFSQLIEKWRNNPKSVSADQAKLASQYYTKGVGNPQQIERALNQATKLNWADSWAKMNQAAARTTQATTQVVGKSHLTIDVNYKDVEGRIIKKDRYHVTTDLTNDPAFKGTRKAPSSRGKAGTPRGGNH